MFGMKIFQQFDRDGSGSISVNELENMLNLFSSKIGIMNINPRDAKYMMYLVDRDRNGQISYEEFRRVLKYLGGVKSYD